MMGGTVEICRNRGSDQKEFAASHPPLATPETRGQQNYPPPSDLRSTKP
jgi:hypothetical protein